MKIIALVENTSKRPEIGCEHGLSLYIEAAGQKILFDMGQSALFAENAAVLGADLAAVSLCVLSHGHYDHGGGLRPEYCHSPGGSVLYQKIRGARARRGIRAEHLLVGAFFGRCGASPLARHSPQGVCVSSRRAAGKAVLQNFSRYSLRHPCEKRIRCMKTKKQKFLTTLSDENFCFFYGVSLVCCSRYSRLLSFCPPLPLFPRSLRFLFLPFRSSRRRPLSLFQATAFSKETAQKIQR